MSAHFYESIVPMILPGGILIASLLGSAHCVAMCGGLVANFARGPKALALYHLGRLASYAALGALAGGFGKLVLASTFSPNVSVAISLVFGALLVALGIRNYLGRPLHFRVPAMLSNAITRALSVATRNPSGLSPLFLGFFSALLPCGWLYTFVLAASATKSMTLGAVSLAVFWLGTVPALSAVPALVNAAASRLRMSAPKLSGAVMISLGLFSLGLHTAPLFSRAPAVARPGSIQQEAAPSCLLHSHSR